MTIRLSDVQGEDPADVARRVHENEEAYDAEDASAKLSGANPSVRIETDQPERVCGVCPNPSSYSRKDVLGRVHRACTVHEPYLAGWVQDVAAEVGSENRAAARYEAAAYGDRDDDY